MASTTLMNEEVDDYASSQDSDFAPDAASRPESDNSDSEDDGVESAKRPRRTTGSDGNYDNSGDEAILDRGRKRQKRAKTKGELGGEEEGGEGGLIKTRRQRAAQKEERKYSRTQGVVTVDVDAIWAEIIAGNTSASQPPPTTNVNETKTAAADLTADLTTDAGKEDGLQPALTNGGEAASMIRIERTYNFAGRVHTEEKLVARDSAEAKLYLASQKEDAPQDALSAKGFTKKAFRSAFEPVVDGMPGRTDLNLGLTARMKAARESQAKKLNTVEKSRMDWAGYVDKEGIKDELELAGKSKDSYVARQDFLARSQALRDDEAKRARLAGRV